MKLPLDALCLMKDGEKLSLEEAVHGQTAVMLGFWAVWCFPRRECLESLAEMAASNRFSGLAFAAVNVDFETIGKADACIKEFAPTLSAYHEGPEGLLTRYLPIKFVPSTAVIASDGEVLYFGRPLSSTLRATLKRFQNYQSVDKPPSEWGGKDRRVL
jgi:thiol-disulfide isomerase/thioredoxin